MSDEQEKRLYRITASVKYGVRARFGDCKVKYKLDGKDVEEYFPSISLAAEHCKQIGIDHFYMFMPDSRWHRIEFDKGQTE